MKSGMGLATAALLLATSAAAVAQVTNGSVLPGQSYGDWSTAAVYKGDDVRFRMVVAGAKENSSLLIDAYAPSCDLGISLGFAHSHSLERDIDPVQIPLSIRIDDKELYRESGSYSGAMGDKLGFLFLSPTLRFNDILADMAAGRVARVKIASPSGRSSEADTEAYSLRGFSGALAYIRQACATFSELPKPSSPRPPRATPPPPSPPPTKRPAPRVEPLPSQPPKSLPPPRTQYL